MEFSHIPVLLGETLSGLMIKPDGIYADGTLGGGGHSYEIARRLGPEGRLIGIDRDSEALEAASARLACFGDRVSIVHGNYHDIPEILADLGYGEADGILLDLGVSSYQFDEASRGFSYRSDAPLDMRMDRDQELTAYTVVNTWSEKELCRILRDYGEERFAASIARHIAGAREKKPVETTLELVDIVKAAIPARMRSGKGHPAKRTFQALRIEVNSELDILSGSVEALIDFLRPGGRLCIISFHSLEDRIVKKAMRKAVDPCTCPKDFPVCVCGKVPKGRMITSRPVTASEEELELNPRSHSARLRIFERTGGSDA